LTAAAATAAVVLLTAAMPAGEPVRRALDAAADRFASRFAAPAAPTSATADRSVEEFARMLARSVERREGRYGILPFGDAFSGAASQGGNAGIGPRGETATDRMGMTGTGWAIASLVALLLMTCRRH
jgi:hypothetical protein